MKLNKNNTRFSDADLTSYLAGELEKSKLDRIKEWLNTDNENMKYFLKLRRLWEVTGKLGEIRLIDVEQARRKVGKKNGGSSQIRTLLFYWRKIAAVLFLPLLVSGLVYFLLFEPAVDGIYVDNEVNIANGTTSHVTLSDGTEVWLNSGSCFKYPVKFNRGKREVYLEGEAYFEINDSRNIPFKVKTSNIEIIATGTAFNIMAYPREDAVVTTLLSGEVTLIKKSENSNKTEIIAVLKSGETAIYNRNEKNAIFREIDTDKIVGWKEGQLIFRNDPLDVIATRLGRWFSADIELVDEELKSYCFTATFVNESLDQILELLCLSTPISYTYSPRTLKSNNTYSKRKIEIRLKK